MNNEELNEPVREELDANEYQETSEQVFSSEIVEEKEFEESREENAEEMTKEIRKERKLSLSSLSSTAIMVVAAATVGVTNLLNVTMKASFNEERMSYRDGSLYYEISVENMTEKESLSLLWKEGKETLETFDVVDEDKDGVVSGFISLNNEEIQNRLRENPSLVIYYDFALQGDVGLNVIRSFDNYRLEIQEAEAEIEGINYACHCGETGYFNFRINFDDPYGTFYDFKAKIIGSNENVRECSFTDNKHEEQQIYVADIGCASGTLLIDFKSTIVEEGYHYEYSVNF